MTDFQKFIHYHLIYSTSNTERDTVMSFAMVGKGEDRVPAKNITDLSDIQLEWGGYYVDQFSKFKIDKEHYINELRENYVLSTQGS